MLLDHMLERLPAWAAEDTPDSGIPMVTQCTLVRNFADIPFSDFASKEEKVAVAERVKGALESLNLLNTGTYYTLDELDSVETRCLAERRLITPDLLLRGGARGVFVWEEDSRVVGYITTRTDADSKIGWIPNIAVLPEYQAKGIGRRLLDAGLEFLRREGMECAKIETLSQNQVGSRFYPSVGFEEVARQIHYVKRFDDHERPS